MKNWSSSAPATYRVQFVDEGEIDNAGRKHKANSTKAAGRVTPLRAVRQRSAALRAAASSAFLIELIQTTLEWLTGMVYELR